MRLWMAVSLAGLLLIGISSLGYGSYHSEPASTPAAGGADVKAQIRTAITHAGFSSGASTLSSVVQHLGHTLNCIEGTRGRNFNQAWGHVCQGMGNGILTDLKAASDGADFVLVAEQADALAVAGVKSRSLNEARMAARGVAALLTVIGDNLK